MKKVLITGITGFAGSYLAEYLASLGTCEIYGTYLTENSLENVSSIKESLSLVKIDLTDFTAVDELIKSVMPDEIYHLAALPSPAESFENPALYIHNNVDIQLHLFSAVRKHKSEAKILIVSSGEIYGQVDESNLPINEDTPFRPTSPYSVSKVTQDMLALQYYISFKMPIIRVRPFNHIGPRQSPAFVVASFAKQVAECEKNGTETIMVGNLSSKRDFTDVRDMVRAYVTVMDKGEFGEVYNIGTGKSISMQELVDTLISHASTQLSTQIDQSRLRPSDIPNVVCDATKVIALGWSAQVPFDQTLKDTLDYWRSNV